MQKHGVQARCGQVYLSSQYFSKIERMTCVNYVTRVDDYEYRIFSGQLLDNFRADCHLDIILHFCRTSINCHPTVYYPKSARRLGQHIIWQRIEIMINSAPSAPFCFCHRDRLPRKD